MIPDTPDPPTEDPPGTLASGRPKPRLSRRLRAIATCFSYEIVAVLVHVAVATTTSLTFVVCGFELSGSPVELATVETPPPTLGTIELELPGHDDPGEVIVLRPGQELSVVLRHETPSDLDVRLYIVAVEVSRSSVPEGTRVVLDPDRSRLVRERATLRYRGPVEQILPLREGTWQLTFMMGDAPICQPQQPVGCREKYAWVQIEGPR